MSKDNEADAPTSDKAPGEPLSDQDLTKVSGGLRGTIDVRNDAPLSGTVQIHNDRP